MIVKTGAGYQVRVRPMRWRHRVEEVPLSEPRDVHRYWCYDSPEAAVLAARVWDVSADSEPVGWVRRGGARP